MEDRPTGEKPLIGYLFRGYYYYPLTDFERLKRAGKITKMVEHTPQLN